MTQDRFCRVYVKWSWPVWTWSWFTSHGVQFGYSSTTYDNPVPAFRFFTKVYHFGPLKVCVGVS